MTWLDRGVWMVSCDPATKQGDGVATWEVGERSADTSTVDKEGFHVSNDVDTMPLETTGGELAGLRMFAGHLDGDVFGHLTPPASFQNGGLQRWPPG